MTNIKITRATLNSQKAVSLVKNKIFQARVSGKILDATSDPWHPKWDQIIKELTPEEQLFLTENSYIPSDIKRKIAFQNPTLYKDFLINEGEIVHSREEFEKIYQILPEEAKNNILTNADLYIILYNLEKGRIKYENLTESQLKSFIELQKLSPSSIKFLFELAPNKEYILRAIHKSCYLDEFIVMGISVSLNLLWGDNSFLKFIDLWLNKNIFKRKDKEIELDHPRVKEIKEKNIEINLEGICL